MQALSIAATIVELALHNWYRYCMWDFGIIYVDSFVDVKQISGDDYIPDINSDCDDYKDFIDDICSEMCDKVDALIAGGVFMLAISSISMGSSAILILLYVYKLKRKHFKLNHLCLIQVAPFITYCIGLVLYGVVSNFSDLKDPDTSGSSGANDAEDFKMKEGFIMAIVVIPFMFGFMLYGIFMTRHAFKVTLR